MRGRSNLLVLVLSFVCLVFFDLKKVLANGYCHMLATI